MPRRFITTEKALRLAAFFLSSLSAPRREAEVLLRKCFGYSPTEWVTQRPTKIGLTDAIRHGWWVLQRYCGWSIDHIVGECEWAGLRIKVTKNVLAPRDETEVLTSHIAAHYAETAPPTTVLDIGTGSGCLALWAKKTYSEAAVMGIDVSQKALICAKDNAKHLSLAIHFAWSDMLSAVPAGAHFDLMTANLPYLPKGLKLGDGATREPHLALFSGDDGLDHYRQLVTEINEKNITFGRLFVEFLPSQWGGIKEVFSAYETAPLTDAGGEIYFAAVTSGSASG